MENPTYIDPIQPLRRVLAKVGQFAWDFPFKDKSGQTVLTWQVQHNGTGKVLYDTYYIYDDFDNLRMVLPPLASGAFHFSTATSWSSETSPEIRNYAYLYCYDVQNRYIAKKLPGCGWSYYVYDKADRLIFSQDGEQRDRMEWTFSIPDAFGRVVLTGTCTNALNYLANPLENSVIKGTWAKITNITKGYIVSGVILTSPNILTATYYDNYEFLGLNAIPDTIAATNTRYEAISGYNTRYTGGYKGMMTGTLTAKLDGAATPVYLYSVMYYDNRRRVIQTKSNNHLADGVEKEYIAYNFTGQPTQRKHIHSATGKTAQTELYTYEYDHAGRLLTTKHKLNTGIETTLVDNEYDELGRLKANKRNGQTDLASNYSYNVRSWTKSITGPLFSQTLYYNDKYISSSVPSYGGNISAMNWTVSGDKKRGYNFMYDNLSRLTGANYLEADAANTNYTTAYVYDKHGNMTSLLRNGRTGASTFGVIDNLTMTYNGNQLKKVEDAIADASITLSESMDFKNGSTAATEYFYDRNGNLIKDLNKGISNIEYNSLNLPGRIEFNTVNQPSNEYIYSAGGAKLSVLHRASATTTMQTDYVGNMIYEGGTLKRILVDGGYIEGSTYYFYLTDHLGDNRVVANASGGIVQTNHYYPFGMSFTEDILNVNKQPYKYNGKELDSERGLNWYDYSARHYDVAVPRFTIMDPMAEKYYSISPYAYCANNPINVIDPDGREIKFVVRQTSSNVVLTYRNGNFWHSNGQRYNPQKENLSKTLYRTLAAYRKILDSGDKVLINQLKTLETSERTHWVEASQVGENNVRPYSANTVSEDNKTISEGKGIGTQTQFDFSEQSKKDLKESTGVPNSDFTTVAHEMQHQYDYDTGNMKDSQNVSGAKDPTEKRAVNNENRARKIEKLPKRTTYGGEKIKELD